MLKPPALKQGDTVAIAAPARHAPQDVIDKGKAALEAMGFKVLVHPQNFLRHHQLAGTDEQRAAALHELFQNPEVKAIICARGGIGSYRTLRHINFDIIRANPKIFCGFSDITTLLASMYKGAGLVTLHGPMCWSFLDPDEHLAAHFKNCLMGNFDYPAAGEVVREGTAEGVLLGGNLTLLQNFIGTKWDMDTRDAILFIEDVDERWSAFDRALHHFAHAGKFAHIKALIVGELTNMKEEEAGPWGDDYKNLLTTLVPPHIPVVVNYPCGHGKMNAALPLGVRARINADASKISKLILLERPFTI